MMLFWLFEQYLKYMEVFNQELGFPHIVEVLVSSFNSLLGYPN